MQMIMIRSGRVINAVLIGDLGRRGSGEGKRWRREAVTAIAEVWRRSARRQWRRGGEEKKWKEKEGMMWRREVLDKIETVV
jgi:hypothetical protein